VQSREGSLISFSRFQKGECRYAMCAEARLSWTIIIMSLSRIFNTHAADVRHPDLPSMTSFNLHFQLPVSKKILAQSCRGHSVERCNKHANDEHRGAEADTLAMAVIEVELK
jgi:hypothetical protein